MKHWIVVACVAILAGCAEPRISVTDASSRRIEFLVQNARLVPVQDVDEQAASHCRQYGLSYRQTEAAWIDPMLKRVAYECGQMEQPPTRKPQVPPRTPAAVAHSAPTKAAFENRKVAAWTKGRTAIGAWMLCLRLDAERKAKERTGTPQLVVEEVVNACSKLEQAVHEPLKAAGEYSSGFQADLHAQAVQRVSSTVTGVRMKADAPVSGPPAF